MIELRVGIRPFWAFVVSLLFAGAWPTPRLAMAQSIVEEDDAHPDYIAEFEPHGIFTPFPSPRGSADLGLGVGLLVGINLAPRGFIPDLNDSVALGLGLDWVNYFGGGATVGECAEYRGSGENAICVRSRGGTGAGSFFFTPAVMQWNIYVTHGWSGFVEPGLALFLEKGRLDPRYRLGITPVFNLGVRYHFAERVAVTLRTGYPYTTAGISLYY